MNIKKYVNLKNICKMVALALMCNNVSVFKQTPQMANFNKKNVLISQKSKNPLKNDNFFPINNTQKNKKVCFNKKERKYVENNIVTQNILKKDKNDFNNNMQNENNSNNFNKQKMQNNHYIEEQHSNLQTTKELKDLQKLDFEIGSLLNQCNILLQEKEDYINKITHSKNFRLKEQFEIKNKLEVLEKTINKFKERIIEPCIILIKIKT